MDQGARQIYRSCHGKQVISQARSLDDKRRLAPNVSMSLCYAFRALSKTMFEHVQETVDREAKSVPLAMCVMELTENQEDSLILSQASVDRGLGLREVVFTEKIRTCLAVENMEYGRPGPSCSHQKVNVSGRDVYHALDPQDGFPRVGAAVEPGDVVLGRIMKIYKRTAAGKDVLTLHCASVETSRRGRIHSVSRAECNDFDVVIVRIYALVRPDVGDKMASRHAQKGTIGAIWPQIDMPWSPTFGYFDAVINPHAFPSRMTIGQFREMMASKVALLEGKTWTDATPFNNEADVSLEYLMGVLRLHGMNTHGTDVVHSGVTGRRYKCHVATGFVDYEFLRHIASMKCFARGGKGSIVKQTRQPTRGNKKGGLAIGEMERDANLAHGAAHTFHALSIANSDPAKAYFCRTRGCGHSVDAPPHSAHMQFAAHKHCRLCDGGDFAVTATSHGHNLLRAELLGCNIKVQYQIACADEP
jgi:DNA-directed RNA polymerase beta subunit